MVFKVDFNKCCFPFSLAVRGLCALRTQVDLDIDLLFWRPQLASEHVRAPKRAVQPDELRCDCGRLIARRVPGGLELRCGRCKERFFIALTDDVRESSLLVKKIA
jgi:phage FluMu protein Com